MKEISATELQARMDDPQLQVVDVREPWELDIAKLDNAINIPLATIPGQLEQLNKDHAVVTVCHHGMRSAQAGNFLEQQGYDVSNLTGGIDAWARAVDPQMDTY